MTELTNLKPIEYENQRILTSNLLAKFYKCEVKHLQQNYNNHKDRFKEGQHYFLIKHTDSEFSIISKIAERKESYKSLIVWTESGALMHAKLLKTDPAWDVYEMLVDLYFRIKNAKQDMTKLTRKEILLLALEAEEEKERLQLQIEQDKAYTDYGKAVECDFKTIPLSDWAGTVGLKPNVLFKRLRGDNILRYDSQGNNVPFQQYIDSGHLVKVEKKNEKEGSPKKGSMYMQTWITGKGRVWLQKKYGLEEKE